MKSFFTCMTARRALGMLLITFAVLQLLFIWNGGANGVFNSPDANANYHFAKRLFEGKTLAIPVPDIGTASEFLFTRSTRIIDGMLIPVGFIGLVLLYGGLSKILFINAIPYFTVFFAVAGIASFYGIIGRIFSRRIALWSAFLLASHPAWWYYTNDSLFPNVTFVSLALIGVWFLFDGAYRQSRYKIALSALFCTLALLVRASEALWFLPLLGALLFLFPRQKVRTVGVFAGIAAVVLAAVLLYVRSTTPLWLPYGYVIDTVTTSANHFSPGAIHPRLILLNGWHYLIKIFWPFTLLAAAGALLLLRTKIDAAKWFWWLLGSTSLTAVLLLLYGSWQVTDHPDPMAVTIASSYVRYFLPVYISALPFAGLFLDAVSQSRAVRAGMSVSVGTVLALAIFLYTTTQIGSPESITAKHSTLLGYDEIAGWTYSHTPVDSIVVTDKSDKYLWPARWVITSYGTDRAKQAIGALSATRDRGIYLMRLAMNESQLQSERANWKPYGVSLSNSIYEKHGIGLYVLEFFNEPVR